MAYTLAGPDVGFLLRLDLSQMVKNIDSQVQIAQTANARAREAKMAYNGQFPRALISYSATVSLSLLGAIWVMQLWQADLSIPFQYLGDAISHATLVKSGIDNGWYLHNSFIGVPGGRDLSEFPLPDNLHFLFFKTFSLFTNNPFLVMNLYFLLTFPLTAATSLLVFRHFKVSTFSAIIVSLLYTFLPYHFMRGLPHILLSAYYMMPLIVMVCLWLYSEAPPFFEGSKEVWRPTLRSPRRRTVVTLVICVLVAASGAYYTFFAGYLFLVGAIGGAVYHRRVRNVVSGMLLVAIITAGMLINILPNLVYRLKHGPNPEVAMRGPNDAEVYGLKLSQLLLPISGHRVPALALLKDRYNVSPLVNENDTSSLGAIGSVGFILLIWQLLFRRSITGSGVLERLSVLNVAALLLGTLGGLGSLFFVLVSAQIRGYNRISVLIAFFSLFAVVLTLDRIWRSVATSRRSLALVSAGLSALLVLGIADQTSESFVPAYRAVNAEFESDARFVKQIEASVPEGSMIFQLPYVPYPENGPVQAMKDYDLFRGYLHSSKLRWSYGAMRGRESDMWQRTVASKSVRELLDTVVLAGFSGIYIDRNGYQIDAEASLEKEMRYLLKASPLVSENRRLAFFVLGSSEPELRARTPEPEWEARRAKALSPVLVNWTSGFSAREGSDVENWRWCSGQGELHLINPTSEIRKIKLEMTVQTGYEQASRLDINSDTFSESLTVTSDGSRFSKEVVLAPGDYIVSFRSDAEQVKAPGDARVLVFRVNNFRLSESP